MAGNSRTSKFYRKNPKAAAKRKAYDRKYSEEELGPRLLTAPKSASATRLLQNVQMAPEEWDGEYPQG